MNLKDTILQTIEKRVMIIDGAMGTRLQNADIKPEEWLDENNQECEGCNELLNATAPHIIEEIYENYAKAGADFITTNTFGSMNWVLDEYNLGHRSYELSKLGIQIAKNVTKKYSTKEKPVYVLGSIGPGTKLPSLGHITYDEMYEGYKIMVQGMVDGGVDVFILETCQDPLQIKAGIHALQDIAPQIPIMVSVTIELQGTMLIGTDVQTIVTILEPFNILSLGFNCGTGPAQVLKHIKNLSQISKFPISVHSNAGLPQNRGGCTYYPMEEEEFLDLQREFLNYDGVSFLGGCCGTTPKHIKTLKEGVNGLIPKKATGTIEPSLASLFITTPLKQDPAPLLIGERSNATGSKAFRELLKANDYEGTLSVAQEQTRSGAHVIDISVGFAGRDESIDMEKVVSLYSQKIQLPLMPDSTQIKALEIALKQIGGKPIVNSVNLEDGEEKFDEVCSLAKRFGASLVCLPIDETGMAKTAKRKVEVAQRIYKRAVELHNFNPSNLVFDMLVFTVGSGDEEYKDAAIQTINAIKEFTSMHPEVGTTLGLSNISFGLDSKARIYLNSIFLHHCVQAGLSSAIVNVKHLIPINKISKEDIEVCENLLFNNSKNGDPLFTFIDHFSSKDDLIEQTNEEFENLSNEEKIKRLLIDGQKDRLIQVANSIKDIVKPEIIVNEWLIDGMKEIGELFGSGKMQLPFVLQSAESMKACVDFLNPFLPKKEGKSTTTLVLGTVKGDVHDVGKNLVDIILSNNGFKVINIGIKADISLFIEAFKKHNADAIGMSGLLVKSTQVMKENLEELKKEGINIPIMLGGAALTKNFVDDYCRGIYDGPIFYCRDAFDSVISMQRIEAGELSNTKLAGDEIEEEVILQKEKIEIVIDPKNITLPIMNKKQLIPPFWGRKVLQQDKSFNKDLAYMWINHRVLFRQRWGYKRGKLNTNTFLEQEENIVKPLYEKLKNEFNEKNLFDPIVLYAYYPCLSQDNRLYIFDEKYFYNTQNEASKLPNLKEAIKILEFPRQSKAPHRSIADFFSPNKLDVVAFTCVSSGLNISDYEKALYDKGQFQDYYHIHGLGVELAEALAEVVHKQIRLDLNIVEKEGSSLKDVQMKGYTGCRYSPGYASCPNLELNKDIFDLLNPQEFGITLSETFQMHPEQTTCAIVVPHKEAKYYNI